MKIQLNTDSHVKGSESMHEKFSEIVEHGLAHYKDRITRVEIFLADENGRKKGEDDKRCIIEARMQNMNPISVTHHANNHEVAAKAAIEKLKKSIESTLGKLDIK